MIGSLATVTDVVHLSIASQKPEGIINVALTTQGERIVILHMRIAASVHLYSPAQEGQ